MRLHVYVCKQISFYLGAFAYVLEFLMEPRDSPNSAPNGDVFMNQHAVSVNVNVNLNDMGMGMVMVVKLLTDKYIKS